jgi:hypothetical protein
VKGWWNSREPKLNEENEALARICIAATNIRQRKIGWSLESLDKRKSKGDSLCQGREKE